MHVSIIHDPWGSLVPMTTTTETVARNIRAVLEEEGYKPTNLTDFFPISYSQATRLWNGKSAYRPEYIAKLARVMGMDPERLVGINPNKTSVWFTVNEAAEATKYHPDTIRKAVYHGEMKATQRCKKGKYLIEQMDLTAWLAGAR